MTRSVWTFRHVLILFAAVLLVVAFLASWPAFGLTQWESWFTAAAFFFVVAWLPPWGTTSP